MSRLTLIFVWGPVLGVMASVMAGLIVLSLVLGKLHQLIENGCSSVSPSSSVA